MGHGDASTDRQYDSKQSLLGGRRHPRDGVDPGPSDVPMASANPIFDLPDAHTQPKCLRSGNQPVLTLSQPVEPLLRSHAPIVSGACDTPSV